MLNLLMEKVERTQYQAALAITGTWKGFNQSKLYKELGWKAISDSHWYRHIPQIHKIKNMAPSYLEDKLADFCMDVITLILFTKLDVRLSDIRTASFLTQLIHGII